MVLKFKKGFSLVELLVVIAIIGILAAVGITAYSGYTANAKAKAATAQNKDIRSPNHFLIMRQHYHHTFLCFQFHIRRFFVLRICWKHPDSHKHQYTHGNYSGVPNKTVIETRN